MSTSPSSLPLADGTAPTSRSYWVVPGRLLAGAYPGGPTPAAHAARVEALFAAGVRTIVSMMEEDECNLTGTPFTPYLADFDRLAAAAGERVRFFRFPTVDGTPPSRDAIRGALDAIDLSLAAGLGVFVHCYGGIGRTGSVIGCWLRRHGHAGAEDVLDVLARLRQGDVERRDRVAPENEAQRALVRGWREGPP